MLRTIIHQIRDLLRTIRGKKRPSPNAYSPLSLHLHHPLVLHRSYMKHPLKQEILARLRAEISRQGARGRHANRT